MIKYFLLLVIVFLNSCVKEQPPKLVQTNTHKIKIYSPTHSSVIKKWLENVKELGFVNKISEEVFRFKTKDKVYNFNFENNKSSQELLFQQIEAKQWIKMDSSDGAIEILLHVQNNKNKKILLEKLNYFPKITKLKKLEQKALASFPAKNYWLNLSCEHKKQSLLNNMCLLINSWLQAKQWELIDNKTLVNNKKSINIGISLLFNEFGFTNKEQSANSISFLKLPLPLSLINKNKILISSRLDQISSIHKLISEYHKTTQF